MEEINIGSAPFDSQVYAVACGRDKAIDVGLCLRAVVGNGVYVYLLLGLVPVGMSIQYAHASTLKLEVPYQQVGMGVGGIQGMGDNGLARGLTAKAHRGKAYQVEDIGHLDAVQVDDDRVLGLCRGYAFHDDMLQVVGDGQVVYGHLLRIIDDFARLYLPLGFANLGLGGQDGNLCLGKTGLVDI